MNTIHDVFTVTKAAISRYLIYSLLVALVDTMIVWSLTRFWSVSLITANTIGIVFGFILHYFLASKSVFHTEYGYKGLLIYLSTFIFGLVCANWLIYMSYEYMFDFCMIDLRLILSKGVSLVIPFFVLYFARKYLFSLLNKGGQ
ncbi:MAG TPA: hypothetical protein DEF42_20735 [Desulfosporosinus sp.]|nr:hypothetical protein [Desulfosporosinus sp.]